MYSEMLSELLQALPAQLPSFLAAQRWFGGKARQILGVEIADAIPISSDETKAVVLVVTVKYLEGVEETYSVPLIPIAPSSSSFADSAPKLAMENGSVIGFGDALASPQFLAELLDVIKREGEMQGENGRLRGSRTSSFSELFPSSQATRPKPLMGEQSNSSVIYGDRLILKFFRRIEQGDNPDLAVVYCE